MIPLVAIASALVISSATQHPVGVRLTHPGGPDANRARAAQLAGDTTAAVTLLQSPSTSLRAALSRGRPSVLLIAPEYHLVTNSALPYSLNEGAMWAGVGASQRLSAGVAVRYGAVTMVLAPQFITEQNRPFQTVTYPEPDGATRHPLASPFHFPPGSMDLPQRFGETSRRYLDPGQTSITLEGRGVVGGVSTEQQWWGPGIRNALVLSTNAPGIPHAFVGTANPVRTRVGTFEAKWMVGRLEESRYFLLEPRESDEDGLRSYSSIAATWRPSFEPNLALGLARAVYAPWSGGTGLYLPLNATFNALGSVGRPWREPGDTVLSDGSRDQIVSLFARWVFPTAGVEAYGEWGRHEGLGSLGDLVSMLHHTRGYTAGVQAVRPFPAAWGDRLARGNSARAPKHYQFQAEITNLEPSISYRVRPFTEWYASRAVPQGYTHRGRVLGAAIGPSGSSQWLAADLIGSQWTLGIYGSRIRWENQAQFSFTPEFRRADVSLITGVRSAVETRLGLIALEYARTGRLNYLFQAEELPDDANDSRGVDLINHTLRLTLSLGAPARTIVAPR